MTTRQARFGVDERRAAAALRCWFCDQRFTVRDVLRNGILRGRGRAEGGPYHLFICFSCGRENLCEESARGRWFASPTCRVTILDYLFSRLFGAGTAEAETLLAAVSWMRENEERRRYFFELDGDARHRHTSWLRWLSPAEEKGAAKPSAAGDAGRRSRREPPPRGQRADEPPRRPSWRRAVVTPHEVLGIAPAASREGIRQAFRRLALHYHPDKVVHLGAEFERAAHEKFLRLKEAYESLMSREAPDPPRKRS